ncbi:hypothetical protein CEF21_20760 [Bacillus sp. FJAT-42376]|nr:hypothetical protein CEF21_20760 [Bacillus sp. FJAT-42376]
MEAGQGGFCSKGKKPLKSRVVSNAYDPEFGESKFTIVEFLLSTGTFKIFLYRFPDIVNFILVKK